MNNGSKILGLAVVIGLVGCLANEESSTLTGTTRQGLTATGGATQAPILQARILEEDAVPVDPGKLASDSSDDDDDANAARMPNIKHPDLTR